MLEFHIPIVKSVVDFNRGCEGEPPPFNVRLALEDDRNSGIKFPDYNGSYGMDDGLWPEGSELGRTPSMRQAYRDPRDMAFMPDWEGKLLKEPHRNGNDFGRDDWDVDRPEKPCDRSQENLDDDGQRQKNFNEGSKAVEKFGSNKKFSICELLKMRQKNKKAKKTLQTLMELKQVMGAKMNGFQRGGCDGSGSSSKPKSEHETFAMSLIPELKKLDAHQMRQFKWKVFQLIDEISTECDSPSTGVDSNSNGQISPGKQENHFGHSSSSMYGDQRPYSQDSMQMDPYADDVHAYAHQQRYPHQQQHQQQQPRYQFPQTQMQQHHQPYDPYENQLQPTYHSPCQVQCPSPCHPPCPPPCQPCCDSSNHQGSERRSSNAQQQQPKQQSPPKKRNSRQSVDRGGSPSRRVRYE